MYIYVYIYTYIYIYSDSDTHFRGVHSQGVATIMNPSSQTSNGKTSWSRCELFPGCGLVVADESLRRIAIVTSGRLSVKGSTIRRSFIVGGGRTSKFLRSLFDAGGA